MMKPEQQPELDLFLELLELPETARKDRLKELHSRNPELCRRVERLLKSEQASSSWFDGLSSTVLRNQLNELEDYWLRGSRLGNYRISHLIAQGGMGSVFLAHRDDGQFKRTVVIKIIPAGLDDESILERFANETSLLAELQHPGIAQLFDAGKTDDGRAYFVMEYVKGVIITDYCNQHKLTVDARLKLFVDLLQAIQYAHRHLVIHSDIKPSNVMVNEEGMVKLLDFGIAVSTGTQKAPPPAATDFSPAYVTPEQKTGGVLTTAVDVHQLGQLLFELLTGETLSRSGMDLFSNPHTPLTSWARGAPEKLAEQAGNCSTTVKGLLRDYHGDLDAITGKALAVVAEQRYDTADSFRRDIISRWRHQPVSARPLTLSYRALKYLRRNRIWVAAVALILLLSLLFAGFMAWQVHKTEMERNKAVQVTDLLIDAFQVSNPGQNPGRELTASEILDRGLARVRGRLLDQPDLQAALMMVIGRTYQNLGRYAEARKVFEEALSIRRNARIDRPADIAELLVLIAENARLLGNLQDAESLLQQALETNQDEDFHARTISKLGRVYGLQGDFTTARRYLEESIRLEAKLHGKTHVRYAQALNDLASLEFSEGNYHRAETLLRQALSIRDGNLGKSPISVYSPEYATNVNNLGLALFRQGRTEEAEKLFRRAVRLRKRIYLEPHIEQAQSLTNLGLLLNSRGRVDEALPYIEEALAIRLKVLGKNHMRVAEARNNLGMLLMSEGRFDAARREFENAFKTALQNQGIDALPTATILNNLAQANLESRRYRAAKSYYEQALDIRRRKLPAAHLYLSYSLVGLARSLVYLGEPEKAEPLAREALRIRQSSLPSEHWLTGEAWLALAEICSKQECGKEGGQYAGRAWRILSRTKGKNHYLTRHARELLAGSQ
jgi:serine/threonine-protein kinase